MPVHSMDVWVHAVVEGHIYNLTTISPKEFTIYKHHLTTSLSEVFAESK